MKKFNKKLLINATIIDFIISDILFCVYMFTGQQLKPILYTYYALNLLFFISVLSVGIWLIKKAKLIETRDEKEKKK